MLLDEKELLAWLSRLTPEEWCRLNAAIKVIWQQQFRAGTFPVRL